MRQDDKRAIVTTRCPCGAPMTAYVPRPKVDPVTTKHECPACHTKVLIRVSKDKDTFPVEFGILELSEQARKMLTEENVVTRKED